MRLLQPLFALFASSTDSELARMVEYLKAENRILRDKLPKRLTVTARERARLLRLGTWLGSAVKDLITIVTPRAFARWVAAERGGQTTAKPSDRKPGRPRTPEDIRNLVLKIARETGWGYARVLGELRKLGIRTVSKTTVANILRGAGLDPGPKRGGGPGASSSPGTRRRCGRATSWRSGVRRWRGSWTSTSCSSSMSGRGG
jgi:putative transposase